MKFVINKETGEVELVPIDQKTDGASMGSEAVQMEKTGTAASSPQNEDGSGGKGSDTPKESTQDLGVEEGSSGPDLHREFTDQFFEHKTGAEAGADVDPNPNDDGHALIDEVPTTDAEQYTAEYEEGYVPPDESLAEQRAEDFDVIPDEEFIDLE